VIKQISPDLKFVVTILYSVL